MRRRDFLSFLSVVSACPVTALAQSKSIPRIGIIGSLGQTAVDAFKDGLREQGFADGETILILGGPASAATPEAVSGMVFHLISQNIDVIFASGAVAGKAAKDATSIVPIVCLTGDLVGPGLVQSLAHPGGNITGMSILTAEAMPVEPGQVLRQGRIAWSCRLQFDNDLTALTKGAQRAFPLALSREDHRHFPMRDSEVVLRRHNGFGEITLGL